MEPQAYCIHRAFEAAGPRLFRLDRHYFVYALEGSLRLEADGRRWTLPPARGALIEADHPVRISVPARFISASVLFDSAMFKPSQPLAVFDVSPLARELVRECRQWGRDDEDQTPHARQMFRALASVIGQLARTPSPCVLPVPTSREMMRALAMIEDAPADQPDFAVIARATGQSPRTLARRFASEMRMTGRETLQRIRIIHAVEILALGNASITDVALQVGYTSLSAFNAAFRQVMGMTPSQYRMAYRG
ncbi:helix-turn-helix transcriptional regulator [Devosia nitrariae]|uniref:AraC family transcriptional regulator n=1 Tax=Devosia nitrariae TaxID=2071872 RepID=A0ABQ5WAT7_9HYPH|nr:AraC family transcriptional regulator [Devosia nitrariae]GLQ57230.1 AraC family transcriptional regulator [Devosia nitrariae]